MITPVEFTEQFILRAYPLSEYGSPNSRRYAANGLCWYYAYVFKQVLGGEIYSFQRASDRTGHCFVKYKGLFFDAESFDGLSNWKHLQKYLRTVSDEQLVRHNSMNGFFKKWKLSKEDQIVFDKIVTEIKLSFHSKRS